MHGIEYLLDMNQRYSRQFTNPSVKGSREFYRERHSLEIAVFKCMDGRLKLPLITKTPLGIIQPWRNVGGRFNLGWPTGFKDDVAAWHRYALSRSRSCLPIVTYHYARGDTHRGCAGFGYDTDAARVSALRLKKQFDEVFGSGDAFYTVLAAIETDLDALVLHGDNPKDVLDLATLKGGAIKNLEQTLRALYPHMPHHTLKDFLPLVLRNIEHIADVKAAKRPVTEILHREAVIAVGRGYSWLHEPNTAIIIGPYDPQLHEPIATAGRLLFDNLEQKRVPQKHGVTLMASMPYREPGHDRKGAEAKARWLSDFALKVIRKDVPELPRKCPVRWLTTVLFEDTQELTVLAQGRL